jgi:hypothetical protein
MAKQRVNTAVVAALAPICVDNFRRAPGATAQQAELQKVSACERRSFVEKRGWATRSRSGRRGGNKKLVRRVTIERSILLLSMFAITGHWRDRRVPYAAKAQQKQRRNGAVG